VGLRRSRHHITGCLGTLAASRVIADIERMVAINRELEIARRIQSSILPQTMPRVPGLTIAARYRPMTAVAGDFYDFLELDAQRLGILVADVAGHGVPAALIASMAKVALAAQHGHADRPAAVLAGINEVLCGRLAGQYLTAAYLFIDIESRIFRYGAAGHPPMLRSTGSDGSVDEVEQNGVILGVFEHQEYREREDSLHANDRFLMYADGVTEASHNADNFFGLDRLKEILGGGHALEADLLGETVLTAVDEWSGRALGDDVTIVVADWTGLRDVDRLDARI
jgi:sigma-B regulation protein RsbU (phosphoserine phosphatase)